MLSSRSVPPRHGAGVSEMTVLTEAAALAFAHAPVGLIVARHRIIEASNARVCEIFQFREGEIDGQSLSLLYPSQDEFERIGRIGHRCMIHTGRYDDERIMRRRGGELFWCRVRGQSLTPEDPFAHSVWSFADISERRPISRLTTREREVSMLLVRGMTTKEIARELAISPRTAEAHRARLLQKHAARNSAELISRLTGAPL